MASKGTRIKKLPLNKKAYLFGIISFFVIVLILGINVTYAYYYDSSLLSILAGKIGDFDTGDGDVNVIVYKETGKDTNVFTRSYSVPAVGYKFDSTLTKCIKPCDDDSNKNCTISCSQSSSSTPSCYYSYNSTNNNFSVTSEHQVTCKFYFKSESNSDINIYIMKESTTSTEYQYSSKYYEMVENVPAYGYKYAGYSCENSDAIESFEYVSELKKFNVSTEYKNTCYAYFEAEGSADIIVNVYVQSASGSAVYEPVTTIPANKTYKLSTSSSNVSACYDTSGNSTDTTIEYTNGYINVSATEKQTCDVYLDLDD